MKLFWRLYDWNERTFWNSLTKKLMSFLVLFVIDLGYLVVYFREKQAIMAELAQSSIGQDALLRVSQGLDTTLTLMIGLWGGGTLPLVLIGLANNLIVMLATLFAVGAATGAGVVIWGTLLQRLVPPEMIGRVASLDFFVSIAFMPVSIAIAGPLSLIVPIPAIFIVAGVAPTLLAIVALLAGRMRDVETRHPLDT